MTQEEKIFLEKITSVVPSKRQVNIRRMGYYSFIHFGINTFTGKEWGSGKESMQKFNIKHIDTDKWVSQLKKTGSRGIIITAKHHDGFCLFPSKFTDYTIENTPYEDGNGDLLLDLSDSCKKYDMGFGVYLSPWDRHEKTYGTQEYNDFFVNQLTEVCTNYGKLFSVWFDGACGEGENGKKQVYDWNRYYETVRKLQPDACISICGPDVRWIGNENGKKKPSEFAVVPVTDDFQESVMASSQHEEGEKVMLDHNADISEFSGERETLMGRSVCWQQSEMDISVTKKGWFYHKRNERKYTRSVKDLCECFYGSVGHNATLLVNVPPNKNGELPEKFIKRLCKTRAKLEESFKNEIWRDRIDMPDNVKLFFKKQAVSSLYISENIRKGQRVEKFVIFADGKKIYEGNTIGYGEICRFKPVKCSTLEVRFTRCRLEPHIAEVMIFS